MDLVVARTTRRRGRSSRLSECIAFDYAQNSSPESSERMVVSPTYRARTESRLEPKALVRTRNPSAPVNGYLNQSLKDDPLTSETVLTKPVHERRKLRDRHLHYLLPIAEQQSPKHTRSENTDALMDEIVAPTTYTMDHHHHHDRDVSLSPVAMLLGSRALDTPPSSSSCPSLMSARSSAGDLVPDQSSKSLDSQLRKLVHDLLTLWPEGIPAYYGLTGGAPYSFGGPHHPSKANDTGPSQKAGIGSFDTSSIKTPHFDRSKADIKRGRKQRAAAGCIVKEWRCLKEAMQGDESCDHTSRSEFSSMIRHMRNSHSECLYNGQTFTHYYEEESRSYNKTTEQGCELLAIALFRRMNPGCAIPYLRFERLPNGSRRPLPLTSNVDMPLFQMSQSRQLHDDSQHEARPALASPVRNHVAPLLPLSSGSAVHQPSPFLLDRAVSIPAVPITGSTLPTTVFDTASDNVITHLQNDPVAFIGYTEQLNNARAAIERADRQNKRLKRRYEDDINDVEEEEATSDSAVNRADKRRRLNEIERRYDSDVERVERGRSEAIASARTRIEEIARPYFTAFSQPRSTGPMSEMGNQPLYNESSTLVDQQQWLDRNLTPSARSSQHGHLQTERSPTPLVDFHDAGGSTTTIGALPALPSLPMPTESATRPLTTASTNHIEHSSFNHAEGMYWPGLPTDSMPALSSSFGSPPRRQHRQQQQQDRTMNFYNATPGPSSRPTRTAAARKTLREGRTSTQEPTIASDLDLNWSIYDMESFTGNG